MTAPSSCQMDHSTSLLAIDSGNTAIKWGLHDGLRWVEKGSILQGERKMLRHALQQLSPFTSVIISNVAGRSANDDLRKLLDQWQVHQRWITTQTRQCGVHNGYVFPERLGCDRWAALIAAWNHLKRRCLVVNIGTAMTVDVLSDTGEFRGGIILPGPKLMQQALANQTDGIRTAGCGKFQSFPDNTEDAIFSGMIQALSGAIEKMYTLITFNMDNPSPMIVISGGDAALVCDHVHLPYQIMDNLVLEGLLAIARE